MLLACVLTISQAAGGVFGSMIRLTVTNDSTHRWAEISL